MSNSYKWDYGGYIYFLRCTRSYIEWLPTGSIKIGHSINVSQRMTALVHFGSCELLGVIAGSRMNERDVQKQFKHLNISGEWFNPGAELLAYIHRNTIRHNVTNVPTNWLCDIATIQLSLFNTIAPDGKKRRNKS